MILMNCVLSIFTKNFKNCEIEITSEYSIKISHSNYELNMNYEDVKKINFESNNCDLYDKISKDHNIMILLANNNIKLISNEDYYDPNDLCNDLIKREKKLIMNNSNLKEKLNDIKKKNIALKEKILIEKARPDQCGGSEYEDARQRFDKIKLQ
jgi:hypothetical protein